MFARTTIYAWKSGRHAVHVKHTWNRRILSYGISRAQREVVLLGQPMPHSDPCICSQFLLPSPSFLCFSYLFFSLSFYVSARSRRQVSSISVYRFYFTYGCRSLEECRKRNRCRKTVYEILYLCFILCFNTMRWIYLTFKIMEIPVNCYKNYPCFTKHFIEANFFTCSSINQLLLDSENDLKVSSIYFHRN